MWSGVGVEKQLKMLLKITDLLFLDKSRRRKYLNLRYGRFNNQVERDDPQCNQQPIKGA